MKKSKRSSKISNSKARHLQSFSIHNSSSTAVAHRAIQFRNELAHCLENFKLTQETLLSHIPKSVRTMTMRDFGRLYNGNVQAAVRGHQKAKFMSERGEQALEKIDKDTRKRKWVESQENDSEMSQSGSNSDLTRAAKNRKSPRYEKMHTEQFF